MTKRIVIWIVVGFTVSVGTVVLLFAMSGMMKDQRHSFLRLLPLHPVIGGKSIDVKYNSYYIAGATSHHVYLGNTSSPLHLLALNTALTDSVSIELRVDGIMDQKFWSLRVRVDSPNFYLYDGAVPRLYKGNVSDWHARRFPYDSVYFLDFAPIGSSTFWIKSLSAEHGESLLGKISNDTPHYQLKTGLLEKQLDGIFCVDGIMLDDRESNRLIYVYYYRNEYIVMDTSLSLQYRANTIDTISQAKIKVGTFSEHQTRTMTAPPLMVNKGGAVYQNWLFVNSNLLAKNEHPKVFDEASVIDVYQMTTRKYEFSFYLYHYGRKERVRYFNFSGNKLLVLFDTHLEVFDLNPLYFDNDKGEVMPPT